MIGWSIRIRFIEGRGRLIARRGERGFLGVWRMEVYIWSFSVFVALTAAHISLICFALIPSPTKHNIFEPWLRYGGGKHKSEPRHDLAFFSSSHSFVHLTAQALIGLSPMKLTAFSGFRTLSPTKR